MMSTSRDLFYFCRSTSDTNHECIRDLYLGTDAVPGPGGLEVPDVLADHVLPPVPQDLLRRVVTPHNLVNNKYFFANQNIF